MITVNDLGRVLVDDKDIGSVASSILNKIVTPVEVQTALEDQLNAMREKASDDVAAAVAAKDAEVAAAVAAQMDAEAKCAALEAIINDPALTKDDAILEANKSAKQREIDRLTKEKQALEDQVAAKQTEIDIVTSGVLVLPDVGVSTLPEPVVFVTPA